jgi:hypothetical protein
VIELVRDSKISREEAGPGKQEYTANETIVKTKKRGSNLKSDRVSKTKIFWVWTKRNRTRKAR